MKIKPIFEKEFYRDGRGPELRQCIWSHSGKKLEGFTYYNPDDLYDDSNLKHLLLEKVECYMLSGEEVHPNILYSIKSKAAIFEVVDSQWLKQFNSPHVSDCKHFQIVFYDEIYDIICSTIVLGKGKLTTQEEPPCYLVDS